MIWILIVVGSIVQATLGMGFGLAVSPVLALLDASFVPGSMLLLGMLTALLAALPERKAIRWREVAIAVFGRTSGVIIAVTILSFIADRSTFLLAFGVMILIALLFSVSGIRLAFNNTSLAAMGFVSGVTGTITSVGAPPLAIVYQDQEPVHARPTLAAFFTIGCFISIIGLALTGWFQWADLLRVAIVLPPMLLGTWMGRRLISRIDRRYRYALWTISGMAAVQLIIRGLS